MILLKNYILDSTYKEAIVIDNNDCISTTSSHYIPNDSTISHNLDLEQNKLNYIAHHTRNDDLSNYSLIDYM